MSYVLLNNETKQYIHTNNIRTSETLHHSQFKFNLKHITQKTNICEQILKYSTNTQNLIIAN